MSAPVYAVLITAMPAITDPTAGPTDIVASARSLARKRRRELLALAGLPVGAAAGFSKITHGAADCRFLGLLRECLHNIDVFKAFFHAPRIGPDAVRIFTDPRMFGAVSGRFMRHVAVMERHQSQHRIVPMLKFALRIEVLQGRSRSGPMFSSPRKLDEWYQRISRFLAPEDLSHVASAKFPPAPVKSAPGLVEQICTSDRLLREALNMEHCCAQRHYVERLLKGEAYLFAAKSPHGRATVEINLLPLDRGLGVVPAVIQIAGHRNRIPPVPVVRAVRSWAAAAGVSWRVPGSVMTGVDPDDLPF